ncbi:uncharacterized protein [Dendropsophus ebraccatus]|uniref:uncharacterized protein n=1 Tax=Dendropsophus ebraccatus TaxID=150705 RepID=UPI003831C628
MEMPNYGQPAQPFHQGYPVNPEMPSGPPYPSPMNPAVAPGYYPSVNTNAPQVAPYPQFTGIPGYEGMAGGGNDGKFLPPPPSFGPEPGHVPVPTSNDWTIPSIDQETAKHALLEYANGQCCYGSGPAEEMQITQLSPHNTYRYRLETFTESRSCEWVTKPLTEGSLDSPERGPAPQPWEIPVKTPSLFHDEIQEVPVPHTTSKKACQECNGKGKIICQTCNGNGHVKCGDCNGSGQRMSEQCEQCHGSGNMGCKTCHQTNVQTCPGCKGKGQVMTYIEMTVTWKNNIFEYIPDHHTTFSTDLFKKVTGEKMYADEQLLVPPIINFPEPSINQTSQNAVQQHYSQFMSTCRILKQRQTIEMLPLTKVEYSWKGKNCSYFVYGRENKVETKDYPSTCCCSFYYREANINILPPYVELLKKGNLSVERKQKVFMCLHIVVGGESSALCVIFTCLHSHKEEEVSSEVIYLFQSHLAIMEERRGIRAQHPTNYGAMGQPFEPNYPIPQDPQWAPPPPGFSNYPDKAMTSAQMSPAMVPTVMSEGAFLNNPAVVIDGPTAPPSDWETIPGYEGMGSNDGGKCLPPPQPGPFPDTVPTPANTNWTIPSISEYDARKALMDYANNKCCYRSTPAEEMDFNELRPFNTYRYRLETFTESRTCKWVTKPYTGQAIDSLISGIPPQPWDIPIQIPAMFKDEEKKMPIPHTSSLKACPQCLGICRTVCKKCHGTGRVRCWVCNGTGRQFSDSCHHCGGQGTESCKTCNSTRYERCVGCSGRGQILNYIELTVIWKNNIYEFVADHNSEFPTELFKKVNGEKIFMDEQLLLLPLVNFPAQAINQASQNALQQHHAQFSSTTRMLRQRHCIEWLPLTKVEYIWRGNRYDYFVYGRENEVYTDNYPQKCCCVVM